MIGMIEGVLLLPHSEAHDEFFQPYHEVLYYTRFKVYAFPPGVEPFALSKPSFQGKCHHRPILWIHDFR